MKTCTTKCIILGHKNFGEYHKLIFFYTEELGKIKAIAKGARKITSKFTGYLETLNSCTASFYFGPKNIILTEIINTEKTEKTEKETLENISAALQIAEISNRLILENQNVEGLMELINTTSKELKKSKKPLLIIISYIIKLLDKIGIIPNLKETKSSLDLKYIKFIEYVKNENLSAINKIMLSPKESFEIVNLLKKLIENETQSTLLTFTTPSTFSNLSTSKSKRSKSTRSSKK